MGAVGDLNERDEQEEPEESLFACEAAAVRLRYVGRLPAGERKELLLYQIEMAARKARRPRSRADDFLPLLAGLRVLLRARIRGRRPTELERELAADARLTLLGLR